MQQYQREKFLTRHGYISCYAPRVEQKQINIQWCRRLLSITTGFLRELSTIDMANNIGHTLVVVLYYLFSLQRLGLWAWYMNMLSHLIKKISLTMNVRMNVGVK
jgi:hypothetical protein